MDEVPIPKISPEQHMPMTPRPSSNPGGRPFKQEVEAAFGGGQLMSSSDCRTIQPPSITVMLPLLEPQGGYCGPSAHSIRHRHQWVKAEPHSSSVC